MGLRGEDAPCDRVAKGARNARTVRLAARSGPPHPRSRPRPRVRTRDHRVAGGGGAFVARRAPYRGGARGGARRAHRIRRVLSGSALRTPRAGLPPLSRHERQRFTQLTVSRRLARAAALASARPSRPARRSGRATLVRPCQTVPGERLQAPAAQPRHRRGARSGRTGRHCRRGPLPRPGPAVSGPGAGPLRSRSVP